MLHLKVGLREIDACPSNTILFRGDNLGLIKWSSRLLYLTHLSPNVGEVVVVSEILSMASSSIHKIGLVRV